MIALWPYKKNRRLDRKTSPLPPATSQPRATLRDTAPGPARRRQRQASHCIAQNHAAAVTRATTLRARHARNAPETLVNRPRRTPGSPAARRARPRKSRPARPPLEIAPGTAYHRHAKPTGKRHTPHAKPAEPTAELHATRARRTKIDANIDATPACNITPRR